MSKGTENILIVLAAAGLAVALYSAYQQHRATIVVTQAAQNPLSTIGNEIAGDISSVADKAGSNVQKFFDSLWGGISSGGTPEATTTAY